MKKAWLVSCLLGLILIAGLTEAKTVELVLWHELEPGFAQALKTQFKKLEPEIKVRVVRKERSNEALKLLGFDSQSAPDLYFWAHDKVGLYATMGLLEPLDRWISAKEFANFVPVAQKAGLFNGKHYQLPVYYETLLLIYNKKRLAADEVPQNTDRLLAMMKERTKAGFYFYVEQHSTPYYTAPWIHGFNGYLINAKGKPGLSHPKTIAAIAYHKQFLPYMPKDGEWNTVVTLFNEGKAALTLNGPWIIPGARQAGIDLGFAPLPVISQTGKPLTPYAGVQGVMLLKASKNKAAAVKVLKLLLKKELSEAVALISGEAPAHRQAYQHEQIKRNELISIMKLIGESAIPMPNIPELDVIWSTSQTAFAVINMNNGDVEAELHKAQAESLKRIAAMQ